MRNLRERWMQTLTLPLSPLQSLLSSSPLPPYPLFAFVHIPTSLLVPLHFTRQFFLSPLQPSPTLKGKKTCSCIYIVFTPVSFIKLSSEKRNHLFSALFFYTIKSRFFSPFYLNLIGQYFYYISEHIWSNLAKIFFFGVLMF